MTSTSSAPAAHEPPLPAKRRRWPAVLLALLIFAAGFACGVGGTVMITVNRLKHAIHHPEEAPARITARLQRRLDLNSEQAAQIEAILKRRQSELMALRSQFQPQVDEQLDLLRTQIGEVLTKRQRERWRQMFDQFRNNWLPLDGRGSRVEDQRN